MPANADSQRIAELEKDMAQVGSLVDRLDVTIEKLTEVSTTVSQLLAVHDSRLEHQEKIGEKLQDLVETRRVETEGYVKDLHSKIDRVEKDLTDDIEDSNKEVIKKIEELHDKTTMQHKEINERFTKAERWMYLCAGGGAVILWILNNLNIVDFISK